MADTSPTTKHCFDCGETKPRTEFHRSRGRPDGLRAICKVCAGVRTRRHYAEHAEELRAKRRAKYWADPEKERAATRVYAEAHRDECREACRRWRAGIDNVGYQRQWVQEHPAQAKANRRKANRSRRLRKMAAPGSHTEHEWLELVGKCMHSCMGCGKQLSLDELTRDHITPLSRGGGDEIENIFPLCQSCNSRKHTRGAGWYAEQWAGMELPAGFECLAPCPWVFGEFLGNEEYELLQERA